MVPETLNMLSLCNRLKSRQSFHARKWQTGLTQLDPRQQPAIKSHRKEDTLIEDRDPNTSGL